MSFDQINVFVQIVNETSYEPTTANNESTRETIVSDFKDKHDEDESAEEMESVGEMPSSLKQNTMPELEVETIDDMPFHVKEDNI